MERELSQEDINAKISDYLDEIERKLDPRYRKDAKTAIVMEIKNHLEEKVANLTTDGNISRPAMEKILLKFGTPDEIVSEYVSGESEKEDMVALRVAEINKASAGRGLCSAGIHVARWLDLKAGEIVEISGKKTTACIFFPNSEDEGLQIIRFDGLVRLNAGTRLGEIVKVRKARPEPAKRVVVAPTNTKVQI
ncbi:MAG TPA: hypothetical protein VKM55_05055 [Candidatus Lokiarchaeia archaeon]|nr:hypothetical protein [Candidatus Lokiarchaeia archaeon]